MKLVEGREYAKIKNNRAVLYDGELSDFAPDDSRNKFGVIIPEMTEKYLDMVFNIITRKPYPERRRMLVTGIFFDESIYAGYREVEVWKDDLIFFTCINGELVPHVAPKTKKVKTKKVKIDQSFELANLAYDMAADIEESLIDDARDDYFEF